MQDMETESLMDTHYRPHRTGRGNERWHNPSTFFGRNDLVIRISSGAMRDSIFFVYKNGILRNTAGKQTGVSLQSRTNNFRSSRCFV